MADFTYRVYDRDGRQVLQATAECRYDRETERSLIEAGYTIKLNGRRITKKELAEKK